MFGPPERGCFEIPVVGVPGAIGAQVATSHGAGAFTGSPGASNVGAGAGGGVAGYLAARGVGVNQGPSGLTLTALTAAGAAALAVPIGTTITGGAAQFVLSHFQVPPALPPPAIPPPPPPVIIAPHVGPAPVRPAPLPAPAPRPAPLPIQTVNVFGHSINLAGTPAQRAQALRAAEQIFAPAPQVARAQPVAQPVVQPVAVVGSQSPPSAKLITQPTAPALDLTGFSNEAVAAGALPPPEQIPLAQAESQLLPTVSAISQNPFLQKVVSGLELSQIGQAGVALLRGEQLTPEQFGTLAGAAVGAIVGQPGYGAAVGLTVGELVRQLDNLSVQYYGQHLDNLISNTGKAALNLITRQPAQSTQTPLQPLTSQPSQSQQPAPLPLPVQPGFQPAPVPVTPVGQSGTVNPQQPPLIPITPQPSNLPIQQPQHLPVQPAQEGCPPEILALVQRMSECPPEVLQQLFNKFEITAQPGMKPQIVAKEEICLCCESQGDYQSWISSGGRIGNCVQVKPGSATILGE